MREKVDTLFGFMFVIGCILVVLFGLQSIGGDNVIPAIIGCAMMVVAIFYANVRGDDNE